MTVHYIDLQNGSDAANGLSFANRKKTLASVTTATAGDEIRIMKSPDAYRLNGNGTGSFANKSATINTSAPDVLILNLSAVGWTASTNVTVSSSSTKKSSGDSLSIAIASGFTTGKAAYVFGPGLSLTHQQISFWIRPSVQIAANVLRLDVCSDSTGDTPVNSMLIPYTLRANTWHAVTLDNGSNFSDADSLALYCVSDPGTVTILFDCMISTTAPSDNGCLTLNHVIGKNDGEWWSIREIQTNTVIVETGGAASAFNTGRGYSGVTETVAIYAKATIPVVDTVSAAGTAVQNYAGAAGSAGNVVSISGGWDTTNMSSQTGDTFLDCINGNGAVWNNSSARAYVSWSKLGVVRANSLCSSIGTGSSWADVSVINSTSTVISANFASNHTFTNFKALGCAGIFATNSAADNQTIAGLVFRSCTSSSTAVTLQSSGTGNNSFSNITVNNCASSPVAALSLASVRRSKISNIVASDNQNIGLTVGQTPVYGVTTSGNSIGLSTGTASARIYGLTSSDNTGSGVSTSDSGKTVIYDADLSNLGAGAIAEVQVAAGSATVSLHRSTAYGNNVTYSNMGNVSMQTSLVPSGKTYAWQYSPTNPNCTTEMVALGSWEKPIAIVACKGGEDNTFQFACRRDNANLTCNLRVFGGRYPGIGSAENDIVTVVNPSVDTWTNYLITVHPTEDCVIEIFFECYHDGTTTYNAYVGGPVIVT